MERHAALVAIDSDVEIACFWKSPGRLFTKYGTSWKPVTGGVPSVGKRKKHSQYSNNIITPQFVQWVQKINQC